MKPTLFAMIAFLAVTASASAIPGDSDYSVSRLEKRMIGESYARLEEDVEVYERFFEHREGALKSAAKRYEKQKEMTRVFSEDVNILKDELEQDDLTESERNDLENQLDAAIKAFEAQSASMKASYKQMKVAEMADSFKTIEKDTLRENQHRLQEHNANNPDDQLDVEPGSAYNKIILGEQMDEVCERESDTFDDMNAANLDMSGALDKMTEEDSDDEDDSTPSDTSPLILYLGSILRYRTYKRKCLHIWELYKGL
ncbi:hypothetical protein BASA83_010226 [Batrachochytrium salamandrivorans]|nr:hypothetical protein BASA81_008511 [Batrachochytrium salamandrivorans]KAH9267028.1 hypothetical protein BASA83_010226 [Batrachochytrium salamandrivorans]